MGCETIACRVLVTAYINPGHIVLVDKLLKFLTLTFVCDSVDLKSFVLEFCISFDQFRNCIPTWTAPRAPEIQKHISVLWILHY